MRTLNLLQLEDRLAPAVGDLFISEVHFTPLFGDQNVHQYVELRGEPGEVIASGTYFVTVSGDGASEAGTIHSVFDLSDQPLGDNGFLVILQGGANYPVNPNATVLQGTDGFGGIPGDIFSDTATLGNRFEFIFGSNTFMLIESATPPVPGEDVDSDADGVLDGPATGWTILDSVGVVGTFVGGNASHIGYGQINFAVDGLGQYPAGSTVVPMDNFSYVGRVSRSTGHDAADWVAGRTTEEGSNTFNFRLTAGIFGNPSQGVYAGRSLDHLGTSNFVASVGGTVFEDLNGDGVFDPGEPGVPGATVFIDRDGDGELGTYLVSVEPDDFAAGTELTNAVDGVTLTEANDQNRQSNRNVTASADANNSSTGEHVIGKGGITFWTPNSRLRMDFYKPVQTVRIDFIGGSSLSDSFGRLEVFDRNGVLLDSFLSPAVRDEATTLEITRPTADIAFAVAHSDSSGSPFGRLDNLEFILPEDSTITETDGVYLVDLLQDDEFTIAVIPSGGTTPTATDTFTIEDTVPIDDLHLPSTGGPGGPGDPGDPGGPGLPPLPIFNATEQNGVPFFAVGAASGGPPRVSVFTPGGTRVLEVLAADPITFRGGMRTAMADVNGDGVPDLITVTGPGMPTTVSVFDGTNGQLLRSFLAFEESFTGGAHVAAGDFNGDGFAEIVVSPDLGGGPRVRVFDGLTGNSVLDFFGIEDPNFRGGARVAVGDINGDGVPDLLVAAGFGGGPRVAGFDGQTLIGTIPRKLFGDFFAFEPTLRNGAYLTAGDLNGDGTADLIFGGGPGGAPRVLIIDGAALSSGAGMITLANFFAGDPNTRTGVRVSAKDFNADGRVDLITAGGTGTNPDLLMFHNEELIDNPTPVPSSSLDVFDSSVTGVFVG